MMRRARDVSGAATLASPYGWGTGSGYRAGGDGPYGSLALVECGARYYDPETGSFLTRDTDLSQSPYAYCGGDPVNLTDPSGHVAQPPPATDEQAAQDRLQQEMADIDQIVNETMIDKHKGVSTDFDDPFLFTMDDWFSIGQSTEDIGYKESLYGMRGWTGFSMSNWTLGQLGLGSPMVSKATPWLAAGSIGLTLGGAFSQAVGNLEQKMSGH